MRTVLLRIGLLSIALARNPEAELEKLIEEACSVAMSRVPPEEVERLAEQT